MDKQDRTKGRKHEQKRIAVKKRFSAPVHSGPGSHPISYTRVTVLFLEGKLVKKWRTVTYVKVMTMSEKNRYQGNCKN
jgi:hypothetical protein